MSSPTPSFRLPQALEIPTHIEHKGEKIPLPDSIRQNFRMLLNGLADSQQASAILTSKIAALTTKINAISPTTVTNVVGQTVGGVNDQTGVANYTLQQTDYGSIVLVNNGGTGVPVTLNSSVSNSFYTKITNNGSTAATLTPDGTYSGAQVISTTSPGGAPSFSLGAGQTINLFFNSVTKNWYAFS